MKTMIVLSIALIASFSQAYTCTATKVGAEEISAIMVPFAGGPVVDGLVRVQLTTLGAVSFVVWEGGPFVAGVPSQHLFANIYDTAGNASALADVTLSKDGAPLSLQFTSALDKQSYSLVCNY